MQDMLRRTCYAGHACGSGVQRTCCCFTKPSKRSGPQPLTTSLISTCAQRQGPHKYGASGRKLQMGINF